MAGELQNSDSQSIVTTYFSTVQVLVRTSRLQTDVSLVRQEKGCVAHHLEKHFLFWASFCLNASPAREAMPRLVAEIDDYARGHNKLNYLVEVSIMFCATYFIVWWRTGGALKQVPVFVLYSIRVLYINILIYIISVKCIYSIIYNEQHATSLWLDSFDLNTEDVCDGVSLNEVQRWRLK